MTNVNITIVSLLSMGLVWYFLSQVIKAKTPTRAKVKALIVVLLFSSLIARFSGDLAAFIQRTLFAFKKDGEVELVNSPFRIPAGQDNRYCLQFTDKAGERITEVSEREDGQYCGHFWRFNAAKTIYLPYKYLNNHQTIFWAAPSLQMIVNTPR